MVLRLRHLTRRQNIWLQFHLSLSLPPWPWANQFIFLCHRYSAGIVIIQLPTSQDCCEKKSGDVREVSTLPLRSYRLTLLFVSSEYYSNKPTLDNYKQRDNYFCRLFYALKTMKFLRYPNSPCDSVHYRCIMDFVALDHQPPKKSWKNQEVLSPSHIFMCERFQRPSILNITVQYRGAHGWEIP